jgi:hypothetical protein
MDLSAPYLRDALCRIELEGWDGATGRQLLHDVRRAVVVPVVRGSGLRGPAADQAEASGWAAAWDALRRPTARTALNPGGMLWTAVRRAVAAEGAFARNVGVGSQAPGRPCLGQVAAGSPNVGQAAPRSADRSDRVAPLRSGDLAANDHEPRLTRGPRPAIRPGVLSLDHLMDQGWQCAAPGTPAADSGPVVTAVLDGLVEAGWERQDAADAVAIMADQAVRTRAGSATTRWRWVSLRLGVAEWRARRLAALLLGGDGWPGVLELVVVHGPGAIGDPAVQAALRSTIHRWAAGPAAWLAEWDTPLEGIA